MTVRCIELAEYALKPGTTDDALRRALQAVDLFLAGRPGFVSPRTLRDGPRFPDLVEWTDLASAQAAEQAAGQSPQAQAYFALLDLRDARMRHFDVVA